MDFLFGIFLLLLLIVIFIFFVYSFFQIKQDGPLYREAWGLMNVLEKNMLSIGVLIFIFIPALKSHPSADWFFASFMLEILPALATGFFVVGILAFMKQVHKLKKD